MAADGKRSDSMRKPVMASSLVELKIKQEVAADSPPRKDTGRMKWMHSPGMHRDPAQRIWTVRR